MVWNPESTAFVWNPESRRWESGIQKVVIQNPDAGIRNLGGWDPESRTFVDSLTWGEIESEAHNAESLEAQSGESRSDLAQNVRISIRVYSREAPILASY